MPDGIRHIRDSGKTVIDGLVACAALALVGCMVLPALSKDRDDARIAQCADHLKQLGQAAHQYAADFEGKYFYNWPGEYSIDQKHQPEKVGYWCDKNRVGRYLEGEQVFGIDIEAAITRGYFSDPKKARERLEQKWVTLGGGVFVCPEDEGGIRSYCQNHWASGIDPEEPLPDGEDLGAFFDSHSDAPLDQLLLFTDTVSSQPTQNGWTPSVLFGRYQMPGERFAEPKSGASLYSDPGHDPVVFRFGGQVKTDLDYVRHGANKNRSLAEGSINIVYADGHVGLRRHDQLYDPTTKISTYDTLWSLLDRQVGKSKKLSQSGTSHRDEY